MTDTLATIALALSVFPASVVVKATAVLGGVSLGLRMLPRAPAPTRHLILASAFAVLAALPVTAVVAPALTVAIDGPAAAPPVILPITVAMPIDQPPSTSSAPAASAAADRSPGAAGWRAVGFAVWVAGVVVFLTPVVLTPLRLRRLQRTARHWHVGDTLLRQIPDGRRRAAVLLHEEVGAPLACGIVRPAIVLPGDVARWADDEIRRALVHEMEHIRRADWLVHLATRIVCAMYWFHPLAWTAWRQLGLEAERACDDAVLRTGEPAAYAQQLVALARRHVTRSPLPALAMAGRTDLSARVRAILDDTQARGRLGPVRAASVVAAAALLTATVAPLRAVPAQAPPAPVDPPAFEVVSLRENTSGGSGQRINRQPGGRLVTSNFTLRSLVLFSYGLQPQHLVGAPDWIDSARYDITAQAAGEFPIAEPGTVGPPQLMMQRLLAERFRLAVHTEARELPIFALTLARSDGRLGPQISKATIDCQAVLTEAIAKAKQGGGVQAAPQRPNGGPACGMMFDGRRVMAGGTSMAALARSLSGMVGRLVEDRTGLAGGFDFDLEFAMDGALAGAGAPVPPTDPNLPSIFTALQEQLGLKLEATRAPVDVLVIDRVERPTPN